MKKIKAISAASMMLLALLLIPFKDIAASDTYNLQKRAGTYRCWSFNVGGMAGKCTSPALILNEDGTYKMGSEDGTFEVNEKYLELSESTIRGKGQFVGTRIIFRYKSGGRDTTVTYLRQKGATKKSKKNVRAEAPEEIRYIIVNLTLSFPRSDNAVDWISTISLVPDGYTLENAPHRPEALAIVDSDQRTVRAYFREVQTGTIYTVYAGTGFDNTEVAKMPLRGVKEDEISISLKGKIPGSEPTPDEAAAPTEKDATPKETPKQSPSRRTKKQITNPNAPLCNDSIPRYAQAGCREK